MSDWWVHSLYHRDPLLLISWIAWVIASIVLHELGHGYAAISQGDPTPRRLGRITLNPAVHIPPLSWVLFAFIGIAWGLMPFDPRNFRHGRWSRAFVAFAGPLVNIVLALVALTALALWLEYGPSQSAAYDRVALVLRVGGWLNITLALFNLLPFPPLDGCMILAAFVDPIDRLLHDPRVQNFTLAALIVLGLIGAFGFMVNAGHTVAQWYVSWVVSMLR